MNIAYATDSAYLTPTLVSIASALIWARDRRNVHLHVLDVGIGDDNWKFFEQKLRCCFGLEFSLTRHVLEQDVFDHLPSYHNSVGIYARLLLPQLLKNEDWCVYCDGDTLFTNDPLALCNVWNSTFQIQGWLDQCNEKHIRWLVENGFGWDEKQYVCSGFLLLNLRILRENDWKEKCLTLIRNHLDIPYPDQDAINSVCAGKIGLLPDEWGIFSRFAFRTESFGLIHYNGDVPWKLMSSYFKDYNDGHKLWFLYARELLGLKMNDLMVGGIRPLTLMRMYAWRVLFKALSCVTRIHPILRRTSIGDYCLRHYATPSQWKHLCSILGSGK